VHALKFNRDLCTSRLLTEEDNVGAADQGDRGDARALRLSPKAWIAQFESQVLTHPSLSSNGVSQGQDDSSISKGRRITTLSPWASHIRGENDLP